MTETTTMASPHIDTPVAPVPREHAPTVWLMWTAISAAFTAIVIQYTMQYGKLVVHPFFDDVAYFCDALLKLQALYRGGLAGLIREVVKAPPHSIFSTLMALASYLVFGARDWAPYTANGLIVLAMAGFVNWMARGLVLWQRVALFLFVLTIPLSAKAVYEFRPDIASAFCAAAGATLLLRQSLTHSSWRFRASAGALFGLAMLIKTPTFPLTLFVFAAALGAASLADRLLLPRQPTGEQIVVSWIQCGLVALVVPLPAYLLQFKEILHYIYEPVFGKANEMWRSQGTRMWHLLYYFTGEGGMDMLSRHLYILLAIFAAGFVLALILERRDLLVRLGCFLAVTAAAYVIPALMSVKQEFFGTTFDFMLIFTAIYALAWVMSEVRFAGWQAMVVVVLLAGLAMAHSPPVLYIPGGANSVARRRIVDQLYGALRAEGVESGPRVFITTTGFVNASVLDYLSLKQGLPTFNFSEISFSGDLKDFAPEIDKADYVIASEQGNSEAYGGFIASGNIQDQTLALVRDSGDFEQVAAFPTLNPKRYFLFKRIPPFAGWEAVNGMGPLEGPYPNWMLPQVRWGYGPKSELRVTVDHEGKFEIKGWARGAFTKLVMTVRVDGREIGWHSFVNDHDFHRFAFAVSLRPGRHQVELAYSDWTKGPGKAMAVLFKSMELVPAAAGAPAMP